ncbi:hypothetical protein AB0E10_42955 [Streptomyces sp. NPDC048045]|uniref:hypothetical protein n=1 Tax=Streptomyces sp. NPDC048045 TaxID=3154710 RepID=UPI00343E5729
MTDGITWVAEEDINDVGHCIVLARNLPPPEDLVRRFADGGPEFLPGTTAEAFTARLDAEGGTGVRYGNAGEPAFAVAHGEWWDVIGPGYDEDSPTAGRRSSSCPTRARTPRSPPPEFTHYRDGRYLCGFHVPVHLVARGDWR